MTSKLGYLPHDIPCLANGIQALTDGNVLYASPVGFHLASAVATATAVTLTTRQVLGGLVLQDPSGGAVTTTTPTAADLVAAFKGVAVGSSIRLLVRNLSGTAAGLVITMAMGTGVTSYTGNVLTVAANNTAEYLIVFTNVTPGSEAATFYTISSANVSGNTA